LHVINRVGKKETRVRGCSNAQQATAYVSRLGC